MQNPPLKHQTSSIKYPVVWTIAGSDSGGGAGLQADLKAFNAFGVHGCSVVTALTAQNTQGVLAIAPVSEAMLRAQIDALCADLPPVAIKTGMLGSVDACRILAAFLETAPHPPIVCDPVLKSTSGTDLLDPEALGLLKTAIFPHVAVLTPNLPEAEKLIGSFGSAEEAAKRLLGLGATSVLIKGGHSKGAECIDYWTDGNQTIHLASPRIDTRHMHGTGCVLASAIAASFALGKTIPEAVVAAKTFLNQCLTSPAGVGTGHGPMKIEPFLDDPADRPTIR